jgi:GNAT superfamily N-acetyltransferase
MTDLLLQIRILEATAENAPEIADIHLSARQEVMPYVRSPYTAEQTRAWFARSVGTPAGAWWVAQSDVRIVGYRTIYGAHLDHLYVRPGLLRRKIGVTLLNKAKALCSGRLELRAFQRNLDARAFYEAQGFQIAGLTNGENDENEPDVEYVWQRAS